MWNDQVPGTRSQGEWRGVPVDYNLHSRMRESEGDFQIKKGHLLSGGDHMYIDYVKQGTTSGKRRVLKGANSTNQRRTARARSYSGSGVAPGSGQNDQRLRGSEIEPWISPWKT